MYKKEKSTLEGFSFLFSPLKQKKRIFAYFFLKLNIE